MFERLVLSSNEQAEAYLAKVQSADEPLDLAAWTRRLSISYRSSTPPGQDPSDLPVSPLNAIKVFYLLTNLTQLRLESDDEFAALESAMRRRGDREGAKTLIRKVRIVRLVGKVRWDRLIELVGESSRLRELQVGGLYSAEPRRTDSDSDSDSTEETFRIPLSRPRPLVRSNTDTSMLDLTKLPPFAFPSSLERPASPIPLPPRLVPAFPQFANLSRLSLEAPNLSDHHLLSIVSGLRHSLQTFSLLNSNSFSREALIIALRNLRNLFELDLTNCNFPDSTPRGSLSPELDPEKPPLLSPFEFPPHPNLTLPLAPSSPSFDLLDIYTTQFSPSRPITLLELRHPLDYLPLYCPFLQTLKLTCPPTQPSLVSKVFWQKVTKLPLQYLTVGVVESRRGFAFGGGGGMNHNLNKAFKRDKIVDMVVSMRGRLEALAITKECVLQFSLSLL